jgi:large subunit ribosomal protein L18
MSRMDRNDRRLRIHRRIRKRVRGTAERPRLAVFRTLNHIYAQVIDDDRGATIVQASTVDPDLRAAKVPGGTVAAAKSVGELLATRAKAKGLAQVVFDRGGFLYHGRVRALAEAAREGGLEF